MTHPGGDREIGDNRLSSLAAGPSVTGVRGSRSMLVGGGRAVGLVIVALAGAKVVDRVVPGADVAIGPAVGCGRGRAGGDGVRPGVCDRAGPGGAPGW